MLGTILKKLLETMTPDPERRERVARIKLQAQLRRQRRNATRLRTWTGARSV